MGDAKATEDKPDYAALGKLIGKWAAVVIPAILAAVSSYHSSRSDAQHDTQVVKDKAEAGYQVTRQAMEDLDKRIASLEQTVRQLAGQQHPAARRGSRPRPIPPQAIPAAKPAKPLPNDLDVAQKVVYKPEAAPPAPVLKSSPTD